MDEAPDPGLLRSCGECAASEGVYALEDSLVPDPLFGHPHGVEDQLAALGGSREAGGVGGVAAARLDTGREDARRTLRVADQGAHRLAALEQCGCDGVADLPRGPGHQDLHRRILCGLSASIAVVPVAVPVGLGVSPVGGAEPGEDLLGEGGAPPSSIRRITVAARTSGPSPDRSRIPVPPRARPGPRLDADLVRGSNLRSIWAALTRCSATYPLD